MERGFFSNLFQWLLKNYTKKKRFIAMTFSPFGCLFFYQFVRSFVRLSVCQGLCLRVSLCNSCALSEISLYSVLKIAWRAGQRLRRRQ